MKIRTFLSIGLSLGALALAGCQEKISGNLKLLPEGATHFLVKDTNGVDRKIYAGRTTISADSSGEITIGNADREIEIKVPADQIPDSHRRAFEFDLPHASTGQALDIVGTIMSESRVRDEVLDREPCQLRVCSRERRTTRCWTQPGWSTVRVRRIRTVQEVQITFSAPQVDGTSTPVGVFNGKRGWDEDVSRREVGSCQY